MALKAALVEVAASEASGTSSLRAASSAGPSPLEVTSRSGVFGSPPSWALESSHLTRFLPSRLITSSLTFLSPSNLITAGWFACLLNLLTPAAFATFAMTKQKSSLALFLSQSMMATLVTTQASSVW